MTSWTRDRLPGATPAAIRPRRVIARDEVPHDPTGKLLRHVLRAELWEGRQSNFAASSP